MSEESGRETRFLIMFRSTAGERLARIVIDSLRAFGGPLRACEVWAFLLDTDRVSRALPGIEGVQRFPLTVEHGPPPYPFAEKAYACARAGGSLKGTSCPRPASSSSSAAQ